MRMEQKDIQSQNIRGRACLCEDASLRLVLKLFMSMLITCTFECFLFQALHLLYIYPRIVPLLNKRLTYQRETRATTPLTSRSRKHQSNFSRLLLLLCAESFLSLLGYAHYRRIVSSPVTLPTGDIRTDAYLLFVLFVGEVRWQHPPRYTITHRARFPLANSLVLVLMNKGAW